MCVKCERRCVLCQVNAQDPWEGAAGTPAGEQDAGLWGVALSTTAGHAPVPKAEEGPSLQVCASLCASDQSLFSIFSDPSHSWVVLARDLVGLSAWRRFSAAGCKLPLPHFLSSLACPSQILRSIPWACSLRVARCRTHPPRGWGWGGSGLWLGGRTLSAS